MNDSGAFCEVEVEARGGDQVNYYARVAFARRPNTLQVSRRFADLSEARKQGTVTHELGQVFGLDHPDGDGVCARIGPPHIGTPSSQDPGDANDRNVSGELASNAVRAPDAVEG